MSRSTYYWNLRGGGTQIEFIQETDINFGTYTGGTKKYCGVDYDLMNTEKSNPYANQPIGIPNQNSDKDMDARNFRNSYDGQGNKIIDYRCETYNNSGDTAYRFTGLFGEVERCTLKNIVMVASDPANQSGYVRARNYQGRSNQEPAVGALVGIMYRPAAKEESAANAKMAEIINCTVSGYTVELQSDTAWSFGNPAVGGLVGVCFGSITNSSADCTVYNNSEKWGCVGGLVGSLNGTGSITNCYSGGTLKQKNDGRTGGLEGGFLDLYGYGAQANGVGESSLRATQITNSYTTCVRLKENLPGENWNHFAVARTESFQTVSNCYYLNESGVVDFTLAADDSTALTGEQLAELSLDGFGRADVDHTFPSSESLKGQAYPYPAVVQHAGAYVHYGDWYSAVPADSDQPEEEKTVTDAIPLEPEEDQEPDEPQPTEETTD